jgi:hypothetical protein
MLSSRAHGFKKISVQNLEVEKEDRKWKWLTIFFSFPWRNLIRYLGFDEGQIEVSRLSKTDRSNHP